jgi:hypothetical protein
LSAAAGGGGDAGRLPSVAGQGGSSSDLRNTRLLISAPILVDLVVRRNAARRFICTADRISSCCQAARRRGAVVAQRRPLRFRSFRLRGISSQSARRDAASQPPFPPLISAETRISAREMCDAKKPLQLSSYVVDSRVFT